MTGCGQNPILEVSLRDVSAEVFAVVVAFIYKDHARVSGLTGVGWGERHCFVVGSGEELGVVQWYQVFPTPHSVAGDDRIRN